MSLHSSIEWTDATWSTVRGCHKVSPGCKNCYAKTFSERFRGVPGHPFEQGFDVRLVPEKIGVPLTWKRPRRIFVNSMSDSFGDFVPAEYIAAVFGVLAMCQRHTGQILTKRAERLPRWFDGVNAASGGIIDGQVRYCIAHADRYLRRDFHVEYPRWPLPNVWLGVSVEDCKYGLPRIDHLRRTPAAVRFLSIEPLLEDIADELDLTGIDWVIIGCESGRGARPFRMAWAERIIELCQATGTKVFLKQTPESLRVPKKQRTLPMLNGRQWAEFPGTP